jgi:hypothetical protein
MKTAHFLAMVSTLALVAGCDMLGGGGGKAHLKGDPTDAAAALAALGLGESGQNGVTFANKNVSGAKAVYTNLTITDTPVEGGEAVPVTIATTTFEGLDLDAAGNPIFGRVTLEGISAKQAAREVTEEVPVFSDPFGDITVDPFDPEAPELPEAPVEEPQFETITRTEPGFDFSVAKVVLDNPSPEVAAWFANMAKTGEQGAEFITPALEKWSFDSFGVESLNFKLDDPASKFDWAMGNISAAKMKDGKLGQSGLSGLKVNFDIAEGEFPIVGSLSMDNFDVKGLNLAVFASAFEAGYNEGIGAEAPATPSTLKMPESPIDPGYDSAKLGALAMNVSGLSLTSAGSTSTTTRDKEGRAIAVNSPTASFVFKADPAAGPLAAPVGGVLGMLGYQQIEFSGASDATWDPATDLTHIKAYNLDVKDAVSVSLTGKLTALKDVVQGLYGINSDPSAAMNSLTNVGINALELKLSDKSLLERSFNAFALTQGGDAAALRQLVVDQIAVGSQGVTALGLDPAFATILSGPITDFVKSGGDLTITLNPPTPVKLSELGDPVAATAEKLGLTVTRK